MTTKPAWWCERAAVRRAALDRAVASLRLSLGQFAGVRGALVFGSYARGDVGPESDLDLVIVRESALPRAERDDDIRRALTLDVPYDLVTLTPDEFERYSRERSFFRQARADGMWIDATGSR